MRLTVLALSCISLCSPLPLEHLPVALVAACLEHRPRYVACGCCFCLDISQMSAAEAWPSVGSVVFFPFERGGGLWQSTTADHLLVVLVAVCLVPHLR